VVRWVPLLALVALQIAYPLADHRAPLVIAIVVLGFGYSVTHAALTRGVRIAGFLLLITTLGGFVGEAVGVATGFPFGQYEYSGALGPRLLSVPIVIPLAWTWMAWPAWLAATHLTQRPFLRVVLAAIGLAAWDLFLDPQMVAEGYWRWAGTDGIPWTNYAGWFAVALAMMALLAATRPDGPRRSDDAPMLALYLWTYASEVLAHAVFLSLPASALRGAIGMGVVALPLAVRQGSGLRSGRR
jgi:uncharacterized membrane protein